jgi:predicted Zn-dependent protease
MKIWTNLCLLFLLLITSSPAYCRLNGGFVVGNKSRNYYIEHPPEQSIQTGKSTDSSESSSNNVLNDDPFAAPCVMSSADGANDRVSLRWTDAAYGTDPFSGVAVLAPGTNGTIGPQLPADATVIRGVNVSGIYVGPLKIIFTESNPAIAAARSALHDLSFPSSETVIQPVAPAAFVSKRASLKAILQIVAAVEEKRVLRILRYKVYANLRPYKLRKIQRCLRANIYSEEAPDLVLAALYTQAGKLEKNIVRRDIYLGTAACYRKDWDTAWADFEQVYAHAKDDPDIAGEVAGIYRKAPGRDWELCIWLSRRLRVVPDWASFEIAYNEREAIEQQCADDEIKNERGPNFTWSSEQMPLKVCFPGADEPGYDKRLIDTFADCIGDWISATGGKIDFVETCDEKNADITCNWQNPINQYTQYFASAKAPRGKPHLSRLGVTNVSRTDQSGPSKAVIDIFACQGCDQRVIDEDILRDVCMHEIGHALGIQIHLHQSEDIMFPYTDDKNPTQDLSKNDKSTIFALYKQHPVNEHAVEKFIGLSATCKRLDFSSMKGRS